MKINVGVLRGGPSHEYEVSLKTGASVLSNISREKYEPTDIFIDKKGIWHIGGLPVEPYNALKRFDVIFNALHGNYGEDGQVQRIIETYDIPFTGSKSMASAVGMNKVLSKKEYKKAGIKTPYHILLNRDNVAEEEDPDAFIVNLFKTFPMPAVIKPVGSGSSVGVFLALDFSSLEDALIKAFEYSDDIMIEEFIKGREATCAVIEGYRDHDLYALPPIEIRPHNGNIFDYDAKYLGKSDEICPALFSHEVKAEIEKLAREAHEALDLDHYSRTDFIIHPKRGIYVLETNTLPGLTPESLLPKALIAVGGDLEDFIDHVLGLALNEKRG